MAIAIGKCRPIGNLRMDGRLMNYSDILENPHFNNLAAIIRVPFLSLSWRKRHADVPFWTLIENFSAVTPADNSKWNKSQVISTFTQLLLELTTADPRLSYTPDDFAWFVGVLDSDQHKLIIKLFQAWFSAPDKLMTPTEIAEQTGTASSTWRNKAANGEIPGSIKKGKQWLIPVSVLRSRGFNVKSTMGEGDE